MMTRNTFIEAAARAFWVSAYADWCEENAPERSARMGQDWMDVAPETPADALELARQFVSALVALNKMEFGAILDHCKAFHEVEELGFCLAMEAMGTGVSWADDHPDHSLKVPDVECNTWDGEHAEGYVSDRLFRQGRAS